MTKMLPEAARRRSMLLRYYALGSLLCTLAVAVALGWVYQFYAERNLIRLAEDSNIALTQAYSNSLWPRFEPLVRKGAGASGDELRAMAATGDLYNAVARQMRGTRVIKVKVYALDGTTVFSSTPKQTGETRSENQALKAAAGGQVTTRLMHRDSIDAFEGTLTDRDIISTYLPIKNEEKRILAVFEIYTDATALLQEVRHTQAVLTALIVGLLALLYGLQVLLVAKVAGKELPPLPDDGRVAGAEAN